MSEIVNKAVTMLNEKISAGAFAGVAKFGRISWGSSSPPSRATRPRM